MFSVFRKTPLMPSLLLALALISACAPKNDSDKTPSEGTQVQSNSTPTPVVPSVDSEASYRLRKKDTSGKTVDDDAKISVKLLQKSSTLNSEHPLVLPAIIPDEIGMTVALKGFSTQSLAGYKITGSIAKDQGVIRQLPETAFSVVDYDAQGRVQIHFSLQDLRRLLPDAEHGVLSVTVSLVDKRATNSTATQIQLVLQSPPSKLSSTPFLPLVKYEQEKKITIADEFRRVYLADNSALELVGILELKNNDADGFNVTVPSKLVHEFNIVTSVKSVSASECGNSTSENVTRAKQDSILYLVPFAQNIEVVAAQTVQSAASSIYLDHGDTVAIGVYSNHPGFLTVPKGDLTTRSVPVRCNAQCTSGGEGDWADSGKWGGSCLDCGRTPGNAGSSCFSCMREHSNWCRWQNWRTWTDSTSVPVGSSFSLEISPEEKGSFSEYALSYGFQKGAARKLRILNQPVVITQ